MYKQFFFLLFNVYKVTYISDLKKDVMYPLKKMIIIFY